MWGLEHGVNEAGVAVGNAAIFTTLDPHDAPPALTGMDLVRLALERATTAEAAVEVILTLLDQYGQGGSGHHGVDDPYWSSFLVADASDAWVVETSGRKSATEHVTRTRALSNRTTIPTFDAEHRDAAMDTRVVVDPRWHASQACLREEPLTVAGLERHLRDHRGEGGWSVCMHVADFSVTTAGDGRRAARPLPERPIPRARLPRRALRVGLRAARRGAAARRPAEVGPLPAPRAGPARRAAGRRSGPGRRGARARRR